jgi:hypothetical protein
MSLQEARLRYGYHDLTLEKALTCVACSFLSVPVLLLAITEDLPRSLVFPISPLLHRPVEGYSPGEGTVIDTAAAIPALIRMQYYRWFAFFGIGYKYVYLADLHAGIAAVADIGIENYRISGADNIG